MCLLRGKLEEFAIVSAKHRSWFLFDRVARFKVALAGTDHTHNRFNPALAPDGQPIPGSAIFSPIPGTTRDFVITWNDYHGFSVSEPYWQPTHDLVAMVR